jgi:ATP-dependent exoDNAse (exonuclease V) alpha subunit
VLVGIGLISLLRTDPRKPVFGADLVARSMDQLGTAKQKATEWAAQDGGLRDSAATAGAMAHDVIQSTIQAAKDIAGKSAPAIDDLGERAQQALPLMREGARTVVDHVSTLSTPSEERDRYLLGAAALALAAAVGIAAQRKD